MENFKKKGEQQWTFTDSKLYFPSDTISCLHKQMKPAASCTDNPNLCAKVLFLQMLTDTTTVNNVAFIFYLRSTSYAPEKLSKRWFILWCERERSDTTDQWRSPSHRNEWCPSSSPITTPWRPQQTRPAGKERCFLQSWRGFMRAEGGPMARKCNVETWESNMGCKDSLLHPQTGSTSIIQGFQKTLGFCTG